MFRFAPIIFLIAALLLAACGTIATPEWQNQGTIEALEATIAAFEAGEGGEAVAAAPTEAEPVEAATVTPTDIPATATPIPATATSVPPTATSIPATSTPTPFAVATESEPVDEGGETVDPASVGDVANGEMLFTVGANGGIPCNTCHLTNAEAMLVGPGLLNLSEHAAQHVEESGSANMVDYLHESIVAPNEYVVPGYSPGLMPQNYGEVYSEDQINDLIAYLLTL